MFEVCGLAKRYGGIPVVDDVTFAVHPGEIVGYIGPNGAGKSTTIKMIVGLIEPSDGQIRFHGAGVAGDLAAFQARIGYVPEESHVYPYLSGWEYLQLAGRLRGLPRARLNPKIEQMLRLFAIYDDRHRPLAGYSKGMRQKILLSAALLHNPELLIFDEPLSGLDVTAALVLRDLMQALAAEGRMILYSSHVLDVLEKVCARVVILDRGRLVAQDSVENLRRALSESSLEGVFERVTREGDHRRTAESILEAMRA